MVARIAYVNRYSPVVAYTISVTSPNAKDERHLVLSHSRGTNSRALIMSLSVTLVVMRLRAGPFGVVRSK